MYSKCGQFLPIESGPRIILPYVVFRVHLSSDSMAWCVSSPIRRQSLGYHSTSPPITQAARGTQSRPLSNLRTPICLPQPDFFSFHRPEVMVNHPIRPMPIFKFPNRQPLAILHFLFPSTPCLPFHSWDFTFCGGKISLTVRCQYVPVRGSRKLVSVIRGKQ